jgi:hypothetical protein
MSRGRKRRSRPIVASRYIAASPELAFRFLDRLENHALLAPGSVEMLDVHTEPEGDARALVSLRGPLRIARTARTVLLRPAPGSTRVEGLAAIGSRTVARATWTIGAAAGECLVTLRTVVVSAGVFDSLLLALGGRRWLAGRFRRALERLSVELAPSGVNAVEQPRPQTIPIRRVASSSSTRTRIPRKEAQWTT